jgi:hypothetical protein
MRRSEGVRVALLVVVTGCSEPDPFVPLGVAEVKCNTHQDARAMPACAHALQHFLANCPYRIVQVVTAEDGTAETERLFVVYTRDDPRWPAASDMVVRRFEGPIKDKRLIVITLRWAKGQSLYVAFPSAFRR